MRVTGIIRRIDDLGRIVIPKEIRRTIQIREGDPLEIFLKNNMVCFKKYDTSEPYKENLKDLISDIKDDIDLSKEKKSKAISKIVEILNVLESEE